MGLVGSKDETGKTVLGQLPPGFLDRKGRDLRDKLDLCLEQNMWYFTIAGILIALPAAIIYKTERPLFAAAVMCPFGDLIYGTARCEAERAEFTKHYKYLQEQYNRRMSEFGDVLEYEQKLEQEQQQKRQQQQGQQQQR